MSSLEVCVHELSAALSDRSTSTTTLRRLIARTFVDVVSLCKTSLDEEVLSSFPVVESVFRMVLSSSLPLFSKPLLFLLRDSYFALFEHSGLKGLTYVSGTVDFLMKQVKSPIRSDEGSGPQSARVACLFLLGELFMSFPSQLFSSSSASLAICESQYHLLLSLSTHTISQTSGSPPTSSQLENEASMRTAAAITLYKFVASSSGILHQAVPKAPTVLLDLISTSFSSDPLVTIRTCGMMLLESLVLLARDFTLISLSSLLACGASSLSDPSPAVRTCAAGALCTILTATVTLYNNFVSTPTAETFDNADANDNNRSRRGSIASDLDGIEEGDDEEVREDDSKQDGDADLGGGISRNRSGSASTSTGAAGSTSATSIGANAPSTSGSGVGSKFFKRIFSSSSSTPRQTTSAGIASTQSRRNVLIGESLDNPSGLSGKGISLSLNKKAKGKGGILSFSRKEKNRQTEANSSVLDPSRCISVIDALGYLSGLVSAAGAFTLRGRGATLAQTRSAAALALSLFASVVARSGFLNDSELPGAVQTVLGACFSPYDVDISLENAENVDFLSEKKRLSGIPVPDVSPLTPTLPSRGSHLRQAAQAALRSIFALFSLDLPSSQVLGSLEHIDSLRVVPNESGRAAAQRLAVDVLVGLVRASEQSRGESDAILSVLTSNVTSNSNIDKSLSSGLDQVNPNATSSPGQAVLSRTQLTVLMGCLSGLLPRVAAQGSTVARALGESLLPALSAALESRSAELRRAAAALVRALVRTAPSLAGACVALSAAACRRAHAGLASPAAIAQLAGAAGTEAEMLLTEAQERLRAAMGSVGVGQGSLVPGAAASGAVGSLAQLQKALATRRLAKMHVVNTANFSGSFLDSNAFIDSAFLSLSAKYELCALLGHSEALAAVLEAVNETTTFVRAEQQHLTLSNCYASGVRSIDESAKELETEAPAPSSLDQSMVDDLVNLAVALFTQGRTPLAAAIGVRESHESNSAKPSGIVLESAQSNSANAVYSRAALASRAAAAAVGEAQALCCVAATRILTAVLSWPLATVQQASVWSPAVALCGEEVARALFRSLVNGAGNGPIAPASGPATSGCADVAGVSLLLPLGVPPELSPFFFTGPRLPPAAPSPQSPVGSSGVGPNSLTVALQSTVHLLAGATASFEWLTLACAARLVRALASTLRRAKQSGSSAALQLITLLRGLATVIGAVPVADAATRAALDTGSPLLRGNASATLERDLALAAEALCVRRPLLDALQAYNLSAGMQAVGMSSSSPQTPSSGSNNLFSSFASSNGLPYTLDEASLLTPGGAGLLSARRARACVRESAQLLAHATNDLLKTSNPSIVQTNSVAFAHAPTVGDPPLRGGADEFNVLSYASLPLSLTLLSSGALGLMPLELGLLPPSTSPVPDTAADTLCSPYVFSSRSEAEQFLLTLAPVAPQSNVQSTGLTSALKSKRFLGPDSARLALQALEALLRLLSPRDALYSPLSCALSHFRAPQPQWTNLLEEFHSDSSVDFPSAAGTGPLAQLHALENVRGAALRDLSPGVDSQSNKTLPDLFVYMELFAKSVLALSVSQQQLLLNSIASAVARLVAISDSQDADASEPLLGVRCCRALSSSAARETLLPLLHTMLHLVHCLPNMYTPASTSPTSPSSAAQAMYSPLLAPLRRVAASALSCLDNDVHTMGGRLLATLCASSGVSFTDKTISSLLKDIDRPIDKERTSESERERDLVRTGAFVRAVGLILAQTTAVESFWALYDASTAIPKSTAPVVSRSFVAKIQLNQEEGPHRVPPRTNLSKILASVDFQTLLKMAKQTNAATRASSLFTWTQLLNSRVKLLELQISAGASPSGGWSAADSALLLERLREVQQLLPITRAISDAHSLSVPSDFSSAVFDSLAEQESPVLPQGWAPTSSALQLRPPSFADALPQLARFYAQPEGSSPSPGPISLNSADLYLAAGVGLDLPLGGSLFRGTASSAPVPRAHFFADYFGGGVGPKAAGVQLEGFQVDPSQALPAGFFRASGAFEDVSISSSLEWTSKDPLEALLRELVGLPAAPQPTSTVLPLVCPLTGTVLPPCFLLASLLHGRTLISSEEAPIASTDAVLHPQALSTRPLISLSEFVPANELPTLERLRMQVSTLLGGLSSSHASVATTASAAAAVARFSSLATITAAESVTETLQSTSKPLISQLLVSLQLSLIRGSVVSATVPFSLLASAATQSSITATDVFTEAMAVVKAVSYGLQLMVSIPLYLQSFAPAHAARPALQQLASDAALLLPAALGSLCEAAGALYAPEGKPSTQLADNARQQAVALRGLALRIARMALCGPADTSMSRGSTSNSSNSVFSAEGLLMVPGGLFSLPDRLVAPARALGESSPLQRVARVLENSRPGSSCALDGSPNNNIVNSDACSSRSENSLNVQSFSSTNRTPTSVYSLAVLNKTRIKGTSLPIRNQMDILSNKMYSVLSVSLLADLSCSYVGRVLAVHIVDATYSWILEQQMNEGASPVPAVTSIQNEDDFDSFGSDFDSFKDGHSVTPTLRVRTPVGVYLGLGTVSELLRTESQTRPYSAFSCPSMDSSPDLLLRRLVSSLRERILQDAPSQRGLLSGISPETFLRFQQSKDCSTSSLLSFEHERTLLDYVLGETTVSSVAADALQHLLPQALAIARRVHSELTKKFTQRQQNVSDFEIAGSAANNAALGPWTEAFTARVHQLVLAALDAPEMRLQLLGDCDSFSTDLLSQFSVQPNEDFSASLLNSIISNSGAGYYLVGGSSLTAPILPWKIVFTKPTAPVQGTRGFLKLSALFLDESDTFRAASVSQRTLAAQVLADYLESLVEMRDFLRGDASGVYRGNSSCTLSTPNSGPPSGFQLQLLLSVLRAALWCLSTAAGTTSSADEHQKQKRKAQRLSISMNLFPFPSFNSSPIRMAGLRLLGALIRLAGAEPDPFVPSQPLLQQHSATLLTALLPLCHSGFGTNEYNATTHLLVGLVASGVVADPRAIKRVLQGLLSNIQSNKGQRNESTPSSSNSKLSLDRLSITALDVEPISREFAECVAKIICFCGSSRNEKELKIQNLDVSFINFSAVKSKNYDILISIGFSSDSLLLALQSLLSQLALCHSNSASVPYILLAIHIIIQVHFDILSRYSELVLSQDEPDLVDDMDESNSAEVSSGMKLKDKILKIISLLSTFSSCSSFPFAPLMKKLTIHSDVSFLLTDALSFVLLGHFISPSSSDDVSVQSLLQLMASDSGCSVLKSMATLDNVARSDAIRSVFGKNESLFSTASSSSVLHLLSIPVLAYFSKNNVAFPGPSSGNADNFDSFKDISAVNIMEQTLLRVFEVELFAIPIFLSRSKEDILSSIVKRVFYSLFEWLTSMNSNEDTSPIVNLDSKDHELNRLLVAILSHSASIFFFLNLSNSLGGSLKKILESSWRSLIPFMTGRNGVLLWKSYITSAFSSGNTDILTFLLESTVSSVTLSPLHCMVNAVLSLLQEYSSENHSNGLDMGAILTAFGSQLLEQLLSLVQCPELCEYLNCEAPSADCILSGNLVTQSTQLLQLLLARLSRRSDGDQALEAVFSVVLTLAMPICVPGSTSDTSDNGSTRSTAWIPADKSDSFTRVLLTAARAAPGPFRAALQGLATAERTNAETALREGSSGLRYDLPTELKRNTVESSASVQTDELVESALTVSKGQKSKFKIDISKFKTAADSEADASATQSNPPDSQPAFVFNLDNDEDDFLEAARRARRMENADEDFVDDLEKEGEGDDFGDFNESSGPLAETSSASASAHMEGDSSEVISSQPNIPENDEFGDFNQPTTSHSFEKEDDEDFADFDAAPGIHEKAAESAVTEVAAVDSVDDDDFADFEESSPPLTLTDSAEAKESDANEAPISPSYAPESLESDKNASIDDDDFGEFTSDPFGDVPPPVSAVEPSINIESAVLNSDIGDDLGDFSTSEFNDFGSSFVGTATESNINKESVEVQDDEFDSFAETTISLEKSEKEADNIPSEAVFGDDDDEFGDFN